MPVCYSPHRSLFGGFTQPIGEVGRNAKDDQNGWYVSVNLPQVIIVLHLQGERECVPHTIVQLSTLELYVQAGGFVSSPLRTVPLEPDVDAVVVDIATSDRKASDRGDSMHECLAEFFFSLGQVHGLARSIERLRAGTDFGPRPFFSQARPSTAAALEFDAR